MKAKAAEAENERGRAVTFARPKQFPKVLPIAKQVTTKVTKKSEPIGKPIERPMGRKKEESAQITTFKWNPLASRRR